MCTESQNFQTYSVRIPSDLWKRIMDHKVKTGCPAAETIRRAVVEYLIARSETSSVRR